MIHAIVINQFTKMLTNLLAILSEAEKFAGEKKFDTGVLLQSRLSPDQFSLVQQIRTVLERYRDAGGQVRMEQFAGSGHGPLFDAAEAWSTMFFTFLDDAEAAATARS